MSHSVNTPWLVRATYGSLSFKGHLFSIVHKQDTVTLDHEGTNSSSQSQTGYCGSGPWRYKLIFSSIPPSRFSILHLTPKPHPNPSSQDQSFLTTLPPFSPMLVAGGGGGDVRGNMPSLINGIKSMLMIWDNISYGHRGEVEHGCQARHAWLGLE